VGKRRRPRGVQLDQLLSLLAELQSKCSLQESPCTLLPISILNEDKIFCESVSKMVLTLANQQSQALESILGGIAEMTELIK
jgi:hypothetical protein